MSYFQGFVIPVKEGKKQAYLAMATKAAPVFAEYRRDYARSNAGRKRARRQAHRPAPRGRRRSRARRSSIRWVWWPDKATCDAAAEKMMADERMQPDGDMPFDMKRMIYAGFDAAL